MKMNRKQAGAANTSAGVMEQRPFQKRESAKIHVRSLMSKFCRLASIVLAIVSLTGCEKDKSEQKSSGFNSSEEFIENPSVKQAVYESGIDINYGSNPPALSGEYQAYGYVFDASYNLSDLKGAQINSVITLYNQTVSGKISFKESVQGISVTGSGGYITGANGRFTVYIESRQSGSEAGLPNDVTINVALIMSGTKLNSGNLAAVEGLSVITDIQADKSKYPNADAVKGQWWKWEADMSLLGAARASMSVNFNVVQSQLVISEYIINKILK